MPSMQLYQFSSYITWLLGGKGIERLHQFAPAKDDQTSSTDWWSWSKVSRSKSYQAMYFFLALPFILGSSSLKLSPSTVTHSARAVTDLQSACKKMETEYDTLIQLKTKGELQGFGKLLGSESLYPDDKAEWRSVSFILSISLFFQGRIWEAITGCMDGWFFFWFDA